MKERTNITLPKDTRLELQFLGGLIASGDDVWIEISDWIDDKCFVSKDNQNLFRVCKALFEEKVSPDALLIATRFNSMKWDWASGDVYDQVDNLMLAPLNMASTLAAAKELIMIRSKRDAIVRLREAAEIVMEFEGTDLSLFNAGLEEKFSECLQIGPKDDGLIDLHKLAYERAEMAGEEGPQFTIKTPWTTFNDVFGGFRPKDTYGFAGRPSHGKSGVLLGLAENCANRIPENFIDGKPLQVLYLDTEMDGEEQADRLAACIADIDPYLIENGDWRKNKEAVEKVRGVLKDTASMDNFTFKFIPRLSAMELRTVFRKWMRDRVGPDGYGIVVFDYLKLSGDELGTTDNTSLALGHKLDVLKDEIKETSNCTLLFGCQRNRHGEDDDTSIAESDHIQRLATWMGLIKKKSMEEKAEEPVEHFGTHKLIPIKWRKLGRDGWKFENPIKINGKYCPNWLNLSFDNFNFRERDDGRAVQDYLNLTSANKKSDKEERIP